ncbi:alpha/beta fold hydrolase [Ornithinimicrobium sp. W1665]|uniref:alpha/beta fold hydrolase n=1 Tax=Ornithinimicrobium sp. W1665 TaxID=3416666 RepID=UPI003CF60471
MDAQPPVTSGSVDVDGASLYYEERGSGAPVVLIHGGLASSAMWEPLLPDLVDHLRVITPDSRGHGRSTNPGGTLSYAQIADDVAVLVASLGLFLPVVGGYSDGGQVALELAVRHPGVAGALIVGAAYPDFVSTGLREQSRAFLGADEAGVPDLAQVDAQLGDFAGVVKAWHPGGEARWTALLHQTASMWLDYAGLTAEEIGGIQAPTLVFAGDRDDQEGRLDLAVSLYRSLPQGELGICPSADHFAPITPQRAGIHAAMIRDFAHRHSQGC